MKYPPWFIPSSSPQVLVPVTLPSWAQGLQIKVPLLNSANIRIKLDDPRLMPTRGHETDAGADLRSKHDVVVPNQAYLPPTLVDTGVAVKIPVGYVGLVYPRSSMGKIKVTLANGTGVIDSSYRGNIKVLLVNQGSTKFDIEAFDTRIAQLVIVPIILTKFVEGDTSTWFDTERGTGGFGSTGT